MDHFDDSGIDPRIHHSRFVVASDVRNRLYGPAGASAIIGHQKGANVEMIQKLDASLNHFADIVLK